MYRVTLPRLCALASTAFAASLNSMAMEGSSYILFAMEREESGKPKQKAESENARRERAPAGRGVARKKHKLATWNNIPFRKFIQRRNLIITLISFVRATSHTKTEGS